MAATLKAMDGLGCRKSAKELAESAGDAPLLTAWLLAWAGVAETGSVVPAYIWHRDPTIRTMVRTLRATPCGDPACEWCSEHQDPERELKRWFGLDGFRDRPSTAQGGSVQREIVCTHLAGTPLLAVMPTGAGKSLCYQLPAVMRHANTAELTVVISPLVALMVDQVDGIRRRGIDAVVTLNSLLSAPERTQAPRRCGRRRDAALPWRCLDGGGRRRRLDARKRGLPARMHGLGRGEEVGVVALPGMAVAVTYQDVARVMGAVDAPADANDILDQGLIDVAAHRTPAAGALQVGAREQRRAAGDGARPGLARHRAAAHRAVRPGRSPNLPTSAAPSTRARSSHRCSRP